MPCPLCKNAEATADAGKVPLDIECSACGHFHLTVEAHAALMSQDDVAFAVASWVHEQNRLGILPLIEPSTVEWIKAYRRPTVAKRVELYLGTAIQLLDGRLSGKFPISHPILRVASWSSSPADTLALANHLETLGAIENPGSTQERRLLTKGHLLYEEMSARRAGTSQVFVAMWFSDEIKTAFDKGFRTAISAAGYDPVRIDRKEHDGKIDDQIVAEIRRSAFVVADFTEHRGGVYYEAGFAHGLGRRVIFTCRADHLEKLHFDVRQYNTIRWSNPEDLIKPLLNRILALFGAGPLKPDAKPIE